MTPLLLACPTPHPVNTEVERGGREGLGNGRTVVSSNGRDKHILHTAMEREGEVERAVGRKTERRNEKGRKNEEKKE